MALFGFTWQSCINSVSSRTPPDFLLILLHTPILTSRFSPLHSRLYFVPILIRIDIRNRFFLPPPVWHSYAIFCFGRQYDRGNVCLRILVGNLHSGHISLHNSFKCMLELIKSRHYNGAQFCMPAFRPLYFCAQLITRRWVWPLRSMCW